MIIHREIGSSYHHKPKVQGVDYSPFIMVMMVEMLEKMEMILLYMLMLNTPEGGGALRR